jgi:hypothetical protein
MQPAHGTGIFSCQTAIEPFEKSMKRIMIAYKK